jgi:dCTP deaminase
MMLSDKDIKEAINNGKIVVKPKPDFGTQLGSCSIDLRLGTKFRVFNHSRVSVIDPYEAKSLDGLMSEVNIKESETFALHPGEFALAVTEEYLEMPDDMAGMLEGRSSIGRLGIVVHSTANTVDAGFRGNIALELANMGKIPVLLHPGMRICALSFHKLSTVAEIPYYKKSSAKYSNQKSPDESKISQEHQK